jgi:nanoRNase/pAp phosphatase (c-di-AMP/oligoRNAs hydrolase)
MSLREKWIMRLITRADFDGIVCGVLITDREKIDRFLFVEPKAMQDGEVAVMSEDIVCNLPYHKNCRLWFDHHVTNRVSHSFDGRFRIAPSAARVVFEYYPSEAMKRFQELVAEADRIDSGDLTMKDVLDPQKHVLLSFTIDPKEKQDLPYWILLINLLRDEPIDAVMEHAQVRERCRQLREDFDTYRSLLLKNSRQDSNVVIIDFREENFRGRENRFLVYSLFPEANVSVRVFRDTQRPGRTGISVGKNIFNKTSTVNVGEMLSHYGGGGHEGAGSSRIADGDADRVLGKIIDTLKDNR